MSAEWRYATVTGTSPLRIRFDGDDDPRDGTPEHLGTAPPLGSRVWVQMTTGAPIIHGVIT
ncbi:MAG: hypothetical protein HOP99_00695 [Dermatophilaceae bacterium]|nr:hypothetical protein [Dermatophilaceae bacterium]